jgi:hypothetical protein
MIKRYLTIFEQNNTTAAEQYNEGTTARHYDSARTTKREPGQSTWPSLTTRTRRCKALLLWEPDLGGVLVLGTVLGTVADDLLKALHRGPHLGLGLELGQGQGQERKGQDRTVLQ